MKIKSFFAKPFAAIIHRKIAAARVRALADQQAIFQKLIRAGSKTIFGKEHHFETVQAHADFVRLVPIRDYEAFRPYIEQVKIGKANVLWKGSPIYFAKTSGTTSGVKYIPITKDSIHNHIDTARNTLLCYMAESGNVKFANGKMIFLSGSPELERIGNIPVGRLSGIVHHHVPAYLRSNQLPKYDTNCIDDWEVKLDQIVGETMQSNMSLISGIPPWVQMYFDRLFEKTGKKVGELFPEFSVLVQGGVNFEPYRDKLIESIGRKVDIIELFPASEGFFAFQDTLDQPGMLLNTDSGIFFEFIPLAEINQPQPRRLTLADVELGVQYALIISSNAGLWAYNIGDTVKFVSINPYRIVVTGRIKHFISAFGEHVIGEEVESALKDTIIKNPCKVTEFTVAPFISKNQTQSCHQWWVEFEERPADISAFALDLDHALRSKNAYYNDLISGNILRPLEICCVKKSGFVQYMKSVGKLGGQNKVPRLSNDRLLADALEAFRD